MLKKSSKVKNFWAIFSKLSRGYAPGIFVKLRVYKKKVFSFYDKKPKFTEISDPLWGINILY